MAGGEQESNKPIRFGIMGCADIARKISRAIGLAPNAVVSAIASRSSDKARRFASDNGLPQTVTIHGSYESLLDDPHVDAVYMPLPTSLHVRWAVAAAERGKHVLLEKPVALCVPDLDRILEACGSSGVQFMDGTMWMHHPRTAKMKDLLLDPDRFGHLKMVESTLCFPQGGDFLKKDIRVNPDLDALGVLGDLGWYCIRSILWAANYQLPTTAIALPKTINTNEAGVLLSCSSSLLWDDGKTATFHCSFLANFAMDLSITGSNGALRVEDLVIPFVEESASFSFASESDEMMKYEVATELPQEASMVEEFARLVDGVKSGGGKPEENWAVISRKTQLVVDAVKASIDKGFQPVHIN